MTNQKNLLWLGAVVACWTLACQSATAQGTQIKGKLTIGIHDVKMKAGTLYYVRVTGDGFRPEVRMQPQSLPYVRSDFRERFLFKSYYVPKRNETNTLYIAPSIFNLRNKGPLSYELNITPMQLNKPPVLNVKDALVNNDPPYKQGFVNQKHHKAYNLQLKAGLMYVISMDATVRNNLDCYIYLEDGKKKIVARDDDGGEGLNSLLFFRPEANGNYRLIASGLGDALGGFHLTVYSAAEK